MTVSKRDISEWPRRIIVCGGREYGDRVRIRDVLCEYMPHEMIAGVLRNEPTIVHGACRGADRSADFVARQEGFRVEPHPADWKRLDGSVDKGAGFRRNEEMAALGADLCIAFPGGNGTADMIRRAEAHGIPVRQVDA